MAGVIYINIYLFVRAIPEKNIAFYNGRFIQNIRQSMIARTDCTFIIF